MGLLTDPRAGNGKIMKFVLRWERPLCFCMYVGGIVWLTFLAVPAFNNSTYFSENALLPGLVTKECNLEATAKQFHQELLHEMKRYPNEMPYVWMAAKFNQLHLDVNIHNFTLNYPFRRQTFTGQNIYGIARAPRGASTEAIVVSAPYRPPNSVHLTTAPSIALILAFAKFTRQQKYWAKDIIFLVTEHEQLGMQAWLDAYHGVSSGHEDVLSAGDLSGRAGSIQAAINLELHAMKIGSIDVKVEGLNGQLPNLDLFNLAQNMITKEGIRRTFQRRFDTNQKGKFKKWLYQFETLTSMMITQATGVPTGNHGLFHRFGIEAITLEGFEKSGHGPEANFYQIGRVVESIVRSLNNLLERFHQSFFFYLLPSTDRYISIGLYMPPLVLIVGGLFVKAFSSWLKLQDTASKSNDDAQEETLPRTDDTSEESHEEINAIVQRLRVEELKIGSIASEVLWAHIVGVAIMSSPKLLTSIGTRLWDLQTEDSIYYGFATATLLTWLWPLLLGSSARYDDVSLASVIASIELATALLCVAMHNFSLAFLAAAVYVPVVLTITPKRELGTRCRGLLHLVWTLLHPFLLASIVVTVYTCVNFSDEPIPSLFVRSLQAAKQAFVFSIVDSMIYGNWLYNVTAAVMLPNWLLFWNVINRKVTNGP